MQVQDNVIFSKRLNSYFNNEFELKDQRFVNTVGKEKFLLVDDYKSEEKSHFFENVRFGTKVDVGGTFTVHPLGVFDGKILNVTHKMASYFPIINKDWIYGADYVNHLHYQLTSSNDFIVVEEEVFQFLDCFPFAPVHNLDDIYNLLCIYFKDGLKCKLLVYKTDNFYYNQSLESLKRYFNVEYFYVDIERKYLFKKFRCARQTHWIQKDALNFIHNRYVDKIVEKYESANAPFFKKVSIIKKLDPKNASAWDVWDQTPEFDSFKKQNGFFDLNEIANDLDYKIYLLNKASEIFINYFSPFNVNVYKHVSNLTDKKIYLIHGKHPRSQNSNIFEQFGLVGDKKSFYGRIMDVDIYDGENDINKVIKNIKLL